MTEMFIARKKDSETQHAFSQTALHPAHYLSVCHLLSIDYAQLNFSAGMRRCQRCRKKLLRLVDWLTKGTA